MFSFGKTMHNTLAEFLKFVEKERLMKQETLFGSDKKSQDSNSKIQINSKFQILNSIYEEKWIDDWYESKKQKDDYYKLGKKIIKEFYEREFQNPPAGGPPNILKFNGEPALEMPFNLKLGEHTLYGVIDRIDRLNDGVAIIDYKTGQSKAKLDFEAKSQLLIYQIAAQEVLQLKPKQLSYYYLDEGKVISFLGSEQEISEQKEKMLSQIKKIKNSQFEPVPGWQCQNCDFKDICDHRA